MASPPECPICGKERVARYRPFCSARCAEIDLGHWFTGRYAIPAEEPPEGFDDEPPPPPARRRTTTTNFFSRRHP